MLDMHFSGKICRKSGLGNFVNGFLIVRTGKEYQSLMC